MVFVVFLKLLFVFDDVFIIVAFVDVVVVDVVVDVVVADVVVVVEYVILGKGGGREITSTYVKRSFPVFCT